MDLLLHSGRVAPHGPSTTGDALLVRDGRVAWVGRAADAPAHVTRAAPVDLGGRLVTPAFVDAHVHLAETGLHTLSVDLSGARSAEEALGLLAGHARWAGEQSLSVVLGHGWDETAWTDRSGLARGDVDRAVGGRAAYLSRVDMHSAIVSTALVDAAGGAVRLATSPGWDPQGPVSQEAHHAVREATQALLSGGDRERAVAAALRRAAGNGLAQLHEMGAPSLSLPEDFLVVRRLTAAAEAAGGAVPEVIGYWGDLDTSVALELGLAGAAGDLSVDGSIGSRTAALHTEYADAPGEHGALYLEARTIADHVVRCTRAGLQSGFHVIGERAVTELVEGLALAEQEVGLAALRERSHRLEHVEMVDAAQVAALARWHVVASVQPAFDAHWGGAGGLYETRLGARAVAMNPFAALAAAGVRLALGSDTPVTAFDPWGAVRGAVHHRTPGAGLDLASAVEAHTVGGWVAARRGGDPRLPEPLGGTLLPGAPAALAVWDTDAEVSALVAAPDTPGPRCSATLVDGRVAHDADDLFAPVG